MHDNTNAGPAQTGTASALPQKESAQPTGFLKFNDILARVPVGPRTLREWTRKGLIPSIRPVPGGRVFYHWPTVEDALKRLQRGGRE